MLFDAMEFALKDGRKALLRNPAPERDAETMVQLLKQMCGETEFLLRYPEECDWTVEQEQDILAGINASENQLMLACEVGGDIAGMCGLSLNKSLKLRHRATIDISLCRAYWGLGIGKAMLGELCAVALKKGIRQLELEYIEGNDRGRALYEKLGFVQVAEHPEAVRLKSGEFRKLIFMIKML